jgi:hypothetical protein
MPPARIPDIIIQRCRQGTPFGLPENECWPWRRRITDDGYGLVCYGSLKYRAHRVAWAIHNNVLELAPTTWILHSCDNPPCVNPRHLRVGTGKDNADDMRVRGRRTSTKGCMYVSSAQLFRAAQFLEVSESTLRQALSGKV